VPRKLFHQAAINDPSASGGSTVLGVLELARAAAVENRRIVLVEGASDQLALSALAKRRGRDLAAEGITVVVIGGAMNIGRFLDLLGPQGLNVEPAGLCDVGEERYFRRALERAGFGSNLTRADMETLGFYVCDADLEDELIRSLGVDAVLAIAEAQGELGAFRTLQKQQAWQERTEAAQLRRWMGASARRKTRYATLLVEASNLDRVPAPLDRLLAHVSFMR
jgi:hypothetical protein